MMTGSGVDVDLREVRGLDAKMCLRGKSVGPFAGASTDDDRTTTFKKTVGGLLTPIGPSPAHHKPIARRFAPCAITSILCPTWSMCTRTTWPDAPRFCDSSARTPAAE
jgi:hypothetical protein